MTTLNTKYPNTMKKVHCHKCGQSRTPISSKACMIFWKNGLYKCLMRKLSNGKWECSDGFGCSNKKGGY